MERTQEENKIALFTVKQYGFESNYKMENQSLEELMRQFKNARNPFSDMNGERLNPIVFAVLEQSDKVVLSVTADMDNDTLNVYETNAVPEDERTSDNVHIQEYKLTEYLRGIKDITEKRREMEKENPLATAEGLAEENYNMIDGVMNNTPKPKQNKIDSDQRFSIKEKMQEIKDSNSQSINLKHDGHKPSLKPNLSCELG